MRSINTVRFWVKCLVIFYSHVFCLDLYSADSLNYSGRLVNNSGAPIVGPVTIRAELAYTNSDPNIPLVALCTTDVPSVPLTKGVFHIKIMFDCSAAGVPLNQVLAQAPAGESVAIRITDVTNSKNYSYQALHSVPFSNLSEQLVQMGATTGQFLKWNGTKWIPDTIASGAGSVTSVATGTGLTGGPITATGTISIANGGVGTAQIADSSVTDAKIVGVAATKISGAITSAQITDDAIVNADINASAAIDYSKLNVPNLSIPYAKLNIAAGEIPQDRITGFAGAINAVIEDVIADAVTGKGPSQNAVFDALALKADRTNIAQTITTNVVTGLIAPTAGSDAANKTYVDTQTTASSTLANTKVSKAGDTMTGVLTMESATVTGEIHLKELATSGTKYTGFKAPDTLAATLVYALPAASPTSGQVLSSSATGVLSWIAIPSAPVTTVFGRTGAVVSAAGDYNASQITNTAAGNIVATNTQTAINELDTEKQSIATLAADVRAIALTGLSTATNAAITATDSILVAFGKLQKQITDQAASAVGGDVSGTIPAMTVTKIQGTAVSATAPTTGQFFKFNGTNWLGSMVTVGDLKSTALGNLFPGTGCGANQTLYYSVVGDAFSCADIDSLDAAKITTGTIAAARLPASASYWSAATGGINYAGGSVGIGTTTPGAALDVKGSIRMSGATSGYVGFAPAAAAGSTVWTLPVADGTLNQVLTTNGAGVLSWATVASGAGPANTDALAEGSTNLYQTNARTIASTITAPTLTNSAIASGDTIQVSFGKLQAQYNNTLSLALTGLSTATNAAITATDSILVAFGKLQKQITDQAAAISAVGGDVSGTIPAMTVTKIQGTAVSATAPTTGQFFKFNGTNWLGSMVTVGDLKSTALGNLFPGTGCGANQTLNYSVVGDAFSCADIDSLDAAKITTGTIAAARLPASASYWSAATGGINYAGGSVGIGTTTPGAALDVKGSIRMSGATSGYVGFAPAAAAGSTVWTLPATDGTLNQVLTTNGAGLLSWSTAAAGPANTDALAEGSTNLYQTNARTIASTITAPTLTNSAIASGDTIQVSFGKLQAQYNNTLSLALTGLSTATNAAITATDSILVAFGKLQKQITDQAAAISAVGGDVSGTIPAMTVTKIQGTAVSATAPTTGQFFKFNGTNWLGSMVTVGDLKSTALGNLFPGTGCGANQTLYYSVVGDAFSCADIDSLDAAKITTGTIAAARLPASASYWSAATGGINYAGGNIGIDATAPSEKLEVVGNVKIAGSLNATAEKAQASVNSGTSLSLGTLSNGSIYRVALTGNATITLPTDPGIADAMAQVVVVLTQDATGSRSLTWAAPGGDAIVWNQGTTPVVCSGATQKTIYQFMKINGDSNFYGSQVWKQCP